MECGIRKPGSRTPGLRIVGGTDAQRGSWPWHVLLDFDGHEGPIWCGGSILTSFWIVTAAHCFDYGKDPASFTLTAGKDTSSHIVA